MYSHSRRPELIEISRQPEVRDYEHALAELDARQNPLPNMAGQDVHLHSFTPPVRIRFQLSCVSDLISSLLQGNGVQPLSNSATRIKASCRVDARNLGRRKRDYPFFTIFHLRLRSTAEAALTNPYVRLRSLSSRPGLLGNLFLNSERSFIPSGPLFRRTFRTSIFANAECHLFRSLHPSVSVPHSFLRQPKLSEPISATAYFQPKLCPARTNPPDCTLSGLWTITQFQLCPNSSIFNLLAAR